MDEYIQFSAKTKSEAITKAMTELEAPSDQLEIQVISEGSTGFFGFGSKPAIIKARKIKTDFADDEMKEIVDAVKMDAIKEIESHKKPQKSVQKSYSEVKASSSSREEKSFKETRQKAEAPVREQKISAEKKETKKSDESFKDVREKENSGEYIAPEMTETRKDRTESRGTREERPYRDRYQKSSRDKNYRDRSRKGKQVRDYRDRNRYEREERLENVEIPETPVKTGRPIEIITDPEEIKKVEESAAKFLTDVFASMELGEVQITSKYNTTDGCLEVDFEGADMGILIGKRGQTLDSLQYLTSLVVNKGKSSYIRVKLDTEDYRRRRKETLENLARGIAYKVKKTRRPVVLEPMNPYERRIIHSALQANKFVETFSEGEEPYRHVVVRMKRY